MAGLDNIIGKVFGNGAVGTGAKQALQKDSLKGWDHASKLFLPNTYELAPKHSFLYHVNFVFADNTVLKNGVENTNKQLELGMLVKQVSLPKFTMDTKTLNAYNKPTIIQSKVHYNPISVQFHDDAADVVRNFWFDYFNYYYRDSDNSSGNTYEANSHNELSNARQIKDWGYTIRGSEVSSKTLKAPYLKAINIYSLHNKKFSQYTLINPIIKDFAHGEHNASSGGDVMQHSMTVEYESVIYAYGNITKSTVLGWGDLHYDKSPSPLTPAGGGTKSILGQGGILDSASDVISDLSNGNIGSALFKGARVLNGLKGANLKTMALSETMALTRGILSGSPNPFGSIKVPSLGGLLTGLGGAAVLSGVKNTTKVSSPIGIPAATAQGGVATIPNSTSFSPIDLAANNPTSANASGVRIPVAIDIAHAGESGVAVDNTEGP